MIDDADSNTEISDLESAYRWAVAEGHVDGTAPVGIPPERLWRAIAALCDMHLLERTADGQFAPVSPSLAVASLLSTRERLLLEDEVELARRREAIARMRDKIVSFNRVFNEAQNEAGRFARLEAVPDGYAVRDLIEHYTITCEVEVLACQPGGVRPPEILRDALPRDLALLDRGVRLRSLYQHAAQFDGPTIAYAKTVITAGSEIRIAIELPPRMIIFDEVVAIVPTRGNGPGGVVIRDASVVATMRDVFEFAWSGAQPFRGVAAAQGSDASELDEMNQRILQLLAEGMTDKAVAKRLGIAERTIRDRVSVIYRELGARSRFQAGVVARARSLVKD